MTLMQAVQPVSPAVPVRLGTREARRFIRGPVGGGGHPRACHRPGQAGHVAAGPPIAPGCCPAELPGHRCGAVGHGPSPASRFGCDDGGPGAARRDHHALAGVGRPLRRDGQWRLRQCVTHLIGRAGPARGGPGGRGGVAAGRGGSSRSGRAGSTGRRAHPGIERVGLVDAGFRADADCAGWLAHSDEQRKPLHINAPRLPRRRAEVDCDGVGSAGERAGTLGKVRGTALSGRRRSGRALSVLPASRFPGDRFAGNR